MIVELAMFAQLAASCAPQVAVETLAAVARTESGFNHLAIHDNTTRRSHKVSSRAEAIALATELVVVDQHSVDLGIMQINSANFPRLGMTVTDAFDPCRSLAAAQRVLMDGYAAPVAGDDQQPALQQALSRYNTGHPVRGVANGYVQRVQASAEVVVPAIRLRGDPSIGNSSVPVPAPLGGGTPVLVQPLPPPPASWDVYGQARAARGQSAVTYSPNRALTAPVMQAPGPAPGEPIQLRRVTNQQASNDAR